MRLIKLALYAVKILQYNVEVAEMTETLGRENYSFCHGDPQQSL